jgi:hypothetical protein
MMNTKEEISELEEEKNEVRWEPGYRAGPSSMATEVLPLVRIRSPSYANFMTLATCNLHLATEDFMTPAQSLP